MDWKRIAKQWCKNHYAKGNIKNPLKIPIEIHKQIEIKTVDKSDWYMD
mgnify:CR=1 FL=1